MSELFFTTGEVQPGYKPTKLHWEHKEETVRIFKANGVPAAVAEMIPVDYKTAFFIAQRNRMTPAQTYGLLIEEVEYSYITDEGRWLYT